LNQLIAANASDLTGPEPRKVMAESVPTSLWNAVSLKRGFDAALFRQFLRAPKLGLPFIARKLAPIL
jgi:hypothetical protein